MNDFFNKLCDTPHISGNHINSFDSNFVMSNSIEYPMSIGDVLKKIKMFRLWFLGCEFLESNDIKTTIDTKVVFLARHVHIETPL